MNKKIKKMWVDALRSGEYKQTKGALKDTNGGFCCLGVLCDLHRKKVLKKRTKEVWKNGCRYQGKNSAGCLPRVVMEWADMDNNNPVCYDASLSVHNDGHAEKVKDKGSIKSKNFHEIADLIEKHL